MKDRNLSSLGGGAIPRPGYSTVSVKIKVNGTNTKVWIPGSHTIDESNSTFGEGGVALAGDTTSFQDLEVGYDNNDDDDIAAGGDDVVVDEPFDGDYDSTNATKFDGL